MLLDMTTIRAVRHAGGNSSHPEFYLSVPENGRALHKAKQKLGRRLYYRYDLIKLCGLISLG